ncbi:sortilin-related receptor [Folsomia candida]|uniref:Low-density lipoprotein receptor-related protein 2 n=1 Tax=Folsomia candida TaxID=158441 RepID=A0A226CUE9_FOLCA|nr:sortilin-related receptor [Folsomia candida]OXA37042.1 Low-density lipoprotein receptor-related protein 2 [Folsomia candida]
MLKVTFTLLSVIVAVALGQPGCGPDEYMCSDGICIPANWECDRWDDCADGSDEVNCACEHRCPDGKCIEENWICDGWTDCSDGWDEANCTCDFQCPDGRCIPSHWVCDGWNDCSDSWDTVDEQDCPCPGETVKCPNVNKCIPIWQWCDADGIWDCPEGTDQANCTMPSHSMKKSNTFTHHDDESLNKLTKEDQAQRKRLNQMYRRFNSQ